MAFIGSLSSKLKLINKPIGIDLVSHKDKDKRINSACEISRKLDLSELNEKYIWKFERDDLSW